MHTSVNLNLKQKKLNKKNLPHKNIFNVFMNFFTFLDPVQYNNLNHSNTIPRISNGSAKTGLTSLYSLSRKTKPKQLYFPFFLNCISRRFSKDDKEALKLIKVDFSGLIKFVYKI